MKAYERAMDAARRLEEALEDMSSMREAGKTYSEAQVDMLACLLEECASHEALADKEVFNGR